MGRTLSLLGLSSALLLHCSGAEPPRRSAPRLGPRARAIAAHDVPGAAAAVPVPPAPEVEDAADFRARMPARDVGAPRPPLGRSATFTFAGTRRGWVASLPDGATVIPSAAFGDGKVYVSGGFSSTTMYALDGETGKFEWRAQAPDGGPTAAIVTGGKVLFNTESCTLFCVDAATGRQKWSVFLGDPMMSQPAASGDLVYAASIASDGSGAYKLTALRIEDGRQVWQRVLETDVLSAPVVVDGAVYATTMGGFVYRFDARTGRRTWRRGLAATSAPWIEGDQMFLSRRRPGGKEQQIVVSTATGRIVGEGTTLTARYAAQRPDTGGVPAGWGYEGSRPVLAGGRAYYTMGQELRAKDLRTGEEVWRRRYPASTATRGLTPPAVVHGSLVVGTRGGDVYGVDVDTGLTTFAWRIGEPIPFQPIVANGWVYVTTSTGRVVGLEVGDPGFDGWHMWGGNPQHTGVMTASVTRRAAAAAERRPTEGELRADVEGAERPLPLQHTKVDAVVSGFVARVTVDQTFENPHDQAVEAVYLFPLPADAAVDSMQMRIADRVVNGTIHRKAEARRIYRAARERGALASLLEQERPNLFRQYVANIPPHESVHVTLTYANMLPYEDGHYELAYPLVAAPRYTPGETPDPAAVESPGVRPGAEVELAVHVDAGVPLGAVESASHRIDVEKDGDARANVTLAAGDRIPDEDFVLRWKVAGDSPRAAVLATTRGEDGFFTLMIHPRAGVPDGEIAPREVVFLVDASSSMAGQPLAAARAVVERTLAGLRPTDTFRLVAFGDRPTSIADAALAATPETLAQARRFLQATQAGGATEMKRAIQAALDAPEDAERLRIVALVTDGYVGNEDEVAREIAERLGTARVFPIGVGAAPNRYLLERAAELGRGTVQIVGLADEPGEAARTFASRIARPYLTDVTIDWGGLEVSDVYPRVVPDLYADRPVLVHGRYRGEGHGTVKVGGRIAGRAWSAEIPATLPARARDHEALPSVWARARVHDLMTAMILRESSELREEVTQTGLRFGLVTAYTSFVAVADEVREAPGAATAATRQAPNAPVPSGMDFGGDDHMEHARGALMGSSVGMGFGSGGLGLSGTGMGGGGSGMGSIGVARPMMLAPSDRADSAAVAVPTKVPEVRAGSAEVQGALSRETIQRTIHAHTSEVRACYERALQAHPDLTGRVSVRIHVGPDGRVTAAIISSSTLGDETVQTCIATAVRSWTFERPTGDGNMTIDYPFVFQPARDD